MGAWEKYYNLFILLPIPFPFFFGCFGYPDEGRFECIIIFLNLQEFVLEGSYFSLSTLFSKIPLNIFVRSFVISYCSMPEVYFKDILCKQRFQVKFVHKAVQKSERGEKKTFFL